jgi:hypothetical protein
MGRARDAQFSVSMAASRKDAGQNHNGREKSAGFRC